MKHLANENNEPGCAEEICEGCFGVMLFAIGFICIILRLYWRV